MTRFLALIAMLVLGLGINLTASANAPQSAGRRVATSPDIKFVVDNLNLIRPGLNLMVDAAALKSLGENAVGMDLERLEEIVLAEASFKPKEVKTLSCNHVACGGGGGGGCGPPVCREPNTRPRR
ncbi:MAG: hypothetical protein IT288_12030 [Bdellovibrionales bacterium]|nr:hypothetical protein [Bdellovibrionales bacterium]